MWRIQATSDRGWMVGDPSRPEEQYWFQTSEWAQMCVDHFNRLDHVNMSNRVLTHTDNYAMVTLNPYGLCQPNLSEWTCYLFGSNGMGITWNPNKGDVPNWFWRKMQYLCFGNKWVKKDE